MKAVFITVRTGSKRLPEKCLEPIRGKPSILYVIERAKQTKADIVILCTTVLREDDVLWSIADFSAIHCYRGSAEDKLMRWWGAAKKFGVDFFVTMDGDDLLCEPELVDLAFDQYAKTGADFIESSEVPCGAFTYGIKVSALDKVCEIKGTDDTEMMVPYFKETGLFKVEQLEVPEVFKRPEIRLTLDYKADLKFFRKIFGSLKNPTLRDVIEFLDKYPGVMSINRHCQQKYLDNQKRKTKLILNDAR
jgi:spore coat polysaccharide biosynthesis protein SpsF